MDDCKGCFEQESLETAAQCWTDEETSSIEFDAVLAKAVAKRIKFWMETAAQNERNMQFYSGLLDECAKAIGKECRRLWLAFSFISFLLAIIAILLTVVAK